MLELRAAARRIGGLNAALACLAVLAGCGPAAGAAGAASAARSPGAVAGPASEAGAASQAGTGSAGSPSAGPPAAKAVKHVGFLNGVSCASAANCTAVGDYYRTAAGPQVTLVERWNGTAWRIEPSPGTGRGVTLDSVSCPQLHRRRIAGHRLERRELEGRAAVQPVHQRVLRGAGLVHGRRVTSGGQPESGYFDGRNWTLEPMPRPGHPAQSITLAAVSCAGPGFCLVVGTAPPAWAPGPAPPLGTRPSPSGGTDRPGRSPARSTWPAGTSSARSRAPHPARAPRSAAARRGSSRSPSAGTAPRGPPSRCPA
jgi:hypothetical protein